MQLKFAVFEKRKKLINVSTSERMISTKYCAKHFTGIILVHPIIGYYRYFADKETAAQEFKQIVQGFSKELAESV